MPRLTDDIPAWAGRYVGIEFAERGRDRDGVDCWGLLRLVYAERYGIFLPSHHDGYADTEDAPGVAAVLEAELMGSGNWRAVLGDPDAGDALLFRAGAGHLWHVGVAVSRGRMLHCRRGCDSCVERWDVGVWAPRLEGAFRFAGPVRLAGRVSPLRPEAIHVTLPAGGTIAEMLAAAGVSTSPFLRVWVGDVEIIAEQWAHVRPKPGRTVSVAAVPGGGEGSGKTVMRIVLTIAVVALAVYTGGAAFGAAGAFGTSAVGQGVVAAGVTLVGSLAINALLPPPRPRLSDNSDQRASATITGARNEARPFGVLPQVLGEHRMAPLYGAAPYTEIVGDDQYLRLLFVYGRGPLELSGFRIGETPLEEYEGVELEVREGREGDAPITLYPNTVIEDAASVLLRQDAGWTSRTSDTAANELSIDLTWPRGLVEFSSRGDRQVRTVALEVEYAPAGSGAWTRINGASPGFERGMDYMFRTPEVRLGGQGSHQGVIGWGLGFAGAKPVYLPASWYSWEARGYLYTDGPEHIPYEFGIDGSDACELSIDDRVVVSWYGSHGTAGGGTPDYAAHTGSIRLRRGWHAFRVRVEARTTPGAIAVGWKPPVTPSFVAIPANVLAERASSESGYRGRLAYRWFDTSIFQHSLVVQANRPDQIRRSLAWAVEPGQYDIRVQRMTPDSSGDRILDQVYWSAIRTIRNEDPVKIAGVAKVALRIKATDQLNGVVDQFNSLARSILPDWDAATGQWVERGTSNPASCYRAILQGASNARPIADDRLDLAELQAWHEANDAAGFAFNAVIDFGGTVWERLADVASAGRASFGMRDGRYSIVRDKPQNVPIQHFTPRNSAGFRGRKAFPDLPHALRARYLNRDAGYQQDERIVYDDGYSEANATKFETVEFFGVTSADEVWKHGRYTIAAARLRPEVYELTTDIEHLACTRGDLVLVTHDVPQWGLNFGRVVGLVTDTDNNLVGLRFDEQVTMDAGDAYVVRVRLDDGTSWLRSVTTQEGQHTQIALQGPVSAAEPRPKVGDLWMFGRLGQETRELLVRSIEIDKDLGARLEFVDHAPAVHEADQGEIPPFDPGISQPPVWENRPDAPIIESIRSDDYVMIRDSDGSLRPRMLITLRRPGGVRPIPNAAQVRIRPIPAPGAAGEGPWMHLPLTPIDDNQISIDRVEEGVTYQIRLRTVTATGLASVWVEAEHTVLGKIGPPPDVQAFDVVRLSDGTRRYSWVLGDIPPDIAGVRIRYGPGGQGLGWDHLSPLHDGLLEGASPTEMNAPPAGAWAFAIKMVDTSGNESRNALLIERTLGAPRQEGVAVSVDAKADGWPGTKTGCYASNDRTLVARGRETWETLAFPYDVSTWAQWTTWTLDPFTPIVYEHPTIDAGFVFDFEPAIYAVSDGIRSVQFDYSVDGITWAGWTDLAIFASRTVRARYARFRVTLSIGNGATIPVLREAVFLLRAETITQEIQDLETANLIPELRYGAGDVALPISSGIFAVVRTVSVSFNGSGAGWTWELVNRFTTPGPRVRLYGPAGAPQDATIDAVVRGLRSADGSSAFVQAGRLNFSAPVNSGLLGLA